MPFILVTCIVLKLDKSSSSKEEHPLNIYSILLTLEVTKLFNINDVNLEQLLNKKPILLAFCVLKFDVSKLSKEEQLLNIFSI